MQEFANALSQAYEKFQLNEVECLRRCVLYRAIETSSQHSVMQTLSLVLGHGRSAADSFHARIGRRSLLCDQLFVIVELPWRPSIRVLLYLTGLPINMMSLDALVTHLFLEYT